ncbi:MAG: hypothetical protein RLZZ522_1164 [Verrucomicrobiota bacterium]
MENLRRQLREKFPQAMTAGPKIQAPEAHSFRTSLVNAGETPTLLEEFPAGAISEVVAAGPGAGLTLVMAGLLGEPKETSSHPEMALVDGADGFDPASFSGAACARLLWVRCRSALEMVKAGDWLARDGNLPLVLLDATGLAPHELLALPPSAWWRLKQGAELNGCRLVVLAPLRLVAAARVRLDWSADLRLEDFDERREELWRRLPTTARLNDRTHVHGTAHS